jgi:phosphatidylserine decarboxylase
LLLDGTPPLSGTVGEQTVLRRAAIAIGIAAEGGPIVAAVAIIAIVLLTTGFFWLGVVAVVATAAIALFFRDPERHSPLTDNAVLSAADGVVCSIGEAPMPGDDLNTPYRRVSVFMSPLNVHVNRAPISGEVLSSVHTAGEFSAAFRDIASEHNERNMVTFKDEAGRRHGMMQIAGYLARRIVCRVCPGEPVISGQRVGLIMFGSRVDHFMPAEYRVTVKMGEKVRAGESIIGELQA